MRTGRGEELVSIFELINYTTVTNNNKKHRKMQEQIKKTTEKEVERNDQ